MVRKSREMVAEREWKANAVLLKLILEVNVWALFLKFNFKMVTINNFVVHRFICWQHRKQVYPVGSRIFSWCHLRIPFSIFSVQSLSYVQLLVMPQTAAHQASLSITNSRSLLKLMSIESVMPSNHLILCRLLLLLPSVFPSIRVFSDESVLCIRWPKYWSFSFSIIPSSEYSGLISFKVDGLISLLSKGLNTVNFREEIRVERWAVLTRLREVESMFTDKQRT